MADDAMDLPSPVPSPVPAPRCGPTRKPTSPSKPPTSPLGDRRKLECSRQARGDSRAAHSHTAHPAGTPSRPHGTSSRRHVRPPASHVSVPFPAAAGYDGSDPADSMDPPDAGMFGSPRRRAEGLKFEESLRRNSQDSAPGKPSRLTVHERLSLSSTPEEVFAAERASLLHQLADVNRTADRLRAEKERLAGRLTKAQGTAARDAVTLRSKAEIAQREADAARAALKTKVNEAETLTFQVTELRAEIADLQQRLDSGSMEVTTDLGRERERRIELEREVEEYRRKLASRTQDVQARNDELARERKLFETRLARANKKVEDLQRNARLNKEVQQLQERLENANARNSALAAKMETQTREVDDLRNRLEMRDGEALGKLRTAEEELAQARSRVSDLTNSRDRALEALNHAEEEARKLRTERTELVTKVDTLQGDLDFLQAAGEAEIRKKVSEAELKAQRASSDVMSSLQAVSRERDDLQAQVVRLQEREVELERSLAEIRAQAADATAQQAHGHAIREEAAGIIKDLTEENRRLSEELANSSTVYTAAGKVAGAELDALRAALADREAALEAANKAASVATTQRDELVTVVKQLTAAEEEHSAVVSKLSVEVGKLRAEQQAIQQERAQLLVERKEHVDCIEQMVKERECQTKVFEALASEMSHIKHVPWGANPHRAAPMAAASGTSAVSPSSGPSSVGSRTSPAYAPSHTSRRDYFQPYPSQSSVPSHAKRLSSYGVDARAVPPPPHTYSSSYSRQAKGHEPVPVDPDPPARHSRRDR